jgi:hypothetical protein
MSYAAMDAVTGGRASAGAGVDCPLIEEWSDEVRVEGDLDSMYCVLMYCTGIGRRTDTYLQQET